MFIINIITRLTGHESGGMSSDELFGHLYSQGIAQVPYTFALGLVFAWITIRTGKLWPAILLHSLSNIYGAYLPMGLGLIHPACQVLFVMFTMGVMLPAAIVLCVRKI